MAAMDNTDKKDSKKEKGFLSRAFGKSARKVVLGGLLVTGLMAGVSGTAMAQSYNGGYQDSGTSYTMPQQPWSGDQSYQIKLHNLEEQSALRLEQLRAYEQNRMAQLNQWHTQQVTYQIQAATNGRGGKWNFSRMANVGAQGAAIEARYRQGTVDINTDYRSRQLQEQERLNNQINSLDNYYSRLPQYQGSSYNTNGYRQAQQQRSAPSGTQALSPQQQHDRLVRAYQDAQLNSAKQGRPMPKPQSFGLSPNDPAISGR